MPRSTASLRDFILDVLFTICDIIRPLGCPEDRDCVDPACLVGRNYCERCCIPVCFESDHFKVDESNIYTMPPLALANDLMVFYAPRELYTKIVTVL